MSHWPHILVSPTPCVTLSWCPQYPVSHCPHILVSPNPVVSPIPCVTLSPYAGVPNTQCHTVPISWCPQHPVSHCPHILVSPTPCVTLSWCPQHPVSHRPHILVSPTPNVTPSPYPGVPKPSVTLSPSFHPPARGAVRLRGHPHHRQHHDCHHAAAVHVRLHRGAALQGGPTPAPLPPL